MKLTVIGGGSTYTPELVDGLARLNLPVTELVLMDPAAHRLDLVGGLARRILARLGHPARVRLTSHLDDAIDGADAVLLQLRVGGQSARHRDETFPLAHGCVGQETTGAGGLAKAVRTVPAVLGIAERIRQRAPRAWIVDFTNPVGIVTRALLSEGHRAVGLCNVAIGFQRWIADRYAVRPEQVDLGHIGLNHLTWVLSARIDGADVLPDLLHRHIDAAAAEVELPPSLVTGLGVLPSYYLRYYYAHDQVVAEQRGAPTRAQQVAEIEQQLLDLYADPALDTRPDLLSRRGGAYYSEAAVHLLSSLLGDRPGTQVVNVRNDGTLPFLPDDAVVEVPCTVTSRGARPLPAPDVPALFRGLIADVSCYEELALSAALHGDRGHVLAALLAHPLIRQYDRAAPLADALLARRARDLP